jgi:hypothetical protein
MQIDNKMTRMFRATGEMLCVGFGNMRRFCAIEGNPSVISDVLREMFEKVVASVRFSTTPSTHKPECSANLESLVPA